MDTRKGNAIALVEAHVQDLTETKASIATAHTQDTKEKTMSAGDVDAEVTVFVVFAIFSVVVTENKDPSKETGLFEK